jgi:hypothetical protein
MADPLLGKVEVRNASSKPMVKVDPDAALIKFEILTADWPLAQLGASTTPNQGGVGMLTLHRGGGADPIAKLDGPHLRLGGPGAVGDIVLRDMVPNDTVEISGFGSIKVGCAAHPGDISVRNGIHAVAGISAADASVWCGGGNTFDGRLVVQNGGHVPVVTIEAATGTVTAGGGTKHGALALRTADGKSRVRLNGGTAECLLGGNGCGGDLALFGASAVTPAPAAKATVDIRGTDAVIRAGGNGANAHLVLCRGDAATLAAPTSGTIELRASDAAVRIGGAGQDGDLVMFNAQFVQTIHVNGKTGDIALANADCAEEFDVVDSDIEPGTVLVLGDDGRLRACDSAYDTRVAGIVSGAGDYRPALVLDRQPQRENRRPVALAGKVCCKVEADSAPITVGTLLTTSALTGHARAATERERAFGAVIGKALAALASGTGVVPVLVSLQ